MAHKTLHKNNLLLYALIFLTFLISEPTRNFIDIYQRDLGFSLVTIGIIAGIGSLFALLGNIFPGFLSDKFGRKKVLAFVVAASVLYPVTLLIFDGIIGVFVQLIETDCLSVIDRSIYPHWYGDQGEPNMTFPDSFHGLVQFSSLKVLKIDRIINLHAFNLYSTPPLLPSSRSPDIRWDLEVLYPPPPSRSPDIGRDLEILYPFPL